jgi:hypothetical protein
MGYARGVRNLSRERGISKIALVCIIAAGVAGLAVITVIILAIALPQYNKQLMAAREVAAIQSIRTLHAAETQYYSQYAKYATLAQLGPPAAGAPGLEGADLIPKDLADGKKHGYVFGITVSPQGYSIHAEPDAFGTSGRRTFFSDQTFVVHQNWTAEPADANSAEMK